jgi:hypothetical protein
MTSHRVCLVTVRWQRRGWRRGNLGSRIGIPPGTLTCWPQVSRRAGEKMNSARRASPPRIGRRRTRWLSPKYRNRRRFQGYERLWRIILHSWHLVRVPAGADSATLQRVLQALATTTCRCCRRRHRSSWTGGAGDLRPSFDRLSARGPAPGSAVRQRVCLLQPPTQSGEVGGVGSAMRSTRGSRTCCWMGIVVRER